MFPLLCLVCFFWVVYGARWLRKLPRGKKMKSVWLRFLDSVWPSRKCEGKEGK